jgi:hypothetical protein
VNMAPLVGAGCFVLCVYVLCFAYQRKPLGPERCGCLLLRTSANNQFIWRMSSCLGVTPELPVKSSDGFRLSFGAQIAKTRLYLHSTAVLRYDSNRTEQKINRVENAPAKVHGVKYTGNTPSPEILEIHPKIHPPGWEIHAVNCFPSCSSPV